MKLFNRATPARDRRLRRALLFVLNLALQYAPKGGLCGRVLGTETDAAVAPCDRFEDEQVVMRFIAELEAKGWATARRLPRRKTDADCPDFLFVTMTPEGKRVWNGGDPLDPDIDDGRGGEDEPDYDDELEGDE